MVWLIIIVQKFVVQYNETHLNFLFGDVGPVASDPDGSAQIVETPAVQLKKFYKKKLKWTNI